jgi:creatinine amidohydrolase
MLCKDVARRSGGTILTAPPIYYSYDEHMMDWPGCVSIEVCVFIQYCTQIAESFVRQGFRTVLFVNGHGPNAHLLEAVVRQVVTRTGAKCAAVSWFMAILDVLKQNCHQQVGSCHAEEFETSVYLHLDPEHVHMERAVCEYENFARQQVLSDFDFLTNSAVSFFDWWSKQTSSGIKGDPTLATAETGARLFETAVSRIADIARELRDLQQNPRRSFLVTDALAP